MAVSAVRETRFQGVLYAGIMLTQQPLLHRDSIAASGTETQVVLPLLETDFAAVLNAVVDIGTEDETPIQVPDRAVLLLVIASSGYPGSTPPASRLPGWMRQRNWMRSPFFHLEPLTQ